MSSTSLTLTSPTTLTLTSPPTTFTSPHDPYPLPLYL